MQAHLTVFFVLGVRTFNPRNASTGFLYNGGPAVVLSLVAMAPDDSSLYAAAKVLLSVLETNSAMQQEMKRINGYKVCRTTGVAVKTDHNLPPYYIPKYNLLSL